jgi:hypothetical protein
MSKPNPPPTCPKCGAGDYTWTSTGDTYACGSLVYRGEFIREEKDCLRRQLEQRTRERDEAREAIRLGRLVCDQGHDGGGKMKEHPILFSGEMVRAILEGRKTQTRRVANVNAVEYEITGQCEDPNYWWCERKPNPYDNDPVIIKCPYGVPGDRLWVRESFRVWDSNDGQCFIEGPIKIKRPEWTVEYDATAPGYHREPPYRPSIHMPRWASRITLEITEVRAERLQDITPKDAAAEGSPVPTDEDGSYYVDLCGPCPDEHVAVAAFGALWDSINKKRGYGWETNPFVWALTFKRLEGK